MCINSHSGGKYMKKLLHMSPYLLIILVANLTLVSLIKDTGMAIILLLIALPLLIFLTSYYYGKNQKNISVSYNIITGLLFVPAMVIYLNKTAIIYVVMYMVVSLFGNIIGVKIKK